MSSDNPNSSANNNTALSIAVVVLSAVAIVVMGALVWHGNDVKDVAGFAVFLIPLLLQNIITSRQVGKLQDDSTTVKKAVNGELTAKFAAVHAKVDETNAKVDEVHALMNKTVTP